MEEAGKTYLLAFRELNDLSNRHRLCLNLTLATIPYMPIPESRRGELSWLFTPKWHVLQLHFVDSFSLSFRVWLDFLL